MKLENNGELLVAEYGGIEVRVGEADLARIFLDQIRSAADFNSITAAELLAPRPIDLITLPAIGEEWNGGLYAGITVHDNKPHALVLLPGESERVTWKDAGAWADEAAGWLPSRFDMLVLFQNLKKEFREEWYWTSEVHTGYADFAWMQYFGYGFQDYDRKDNEYRARAVRRVAL